MSGAGGALVPWFQYQKCFSPPVPTASKTLWRRIHQREPSAEDGRVWSSRNGVSPTLGPSPVEQHAGIQVGTPTSCSLRGGEAPPPVGAALASLP